MTTDRELLELAAKAAGHEVARETDDADALLLIGVQQAWNPLTDDGDAFRLAVKLDLMVDSAISDAESKVIATGVWECERHGDDPCAATRRAIVRAAAAIGARS